MAPRATWEPFIDLRLLTVYSMGSALYVLWLLIAGLLVTGVVRNARRAVGFLAGGAGLLALASRIVPPHIAASPPAYLVGLFSGLAVMSLTLPRTLDRGARALVGGTALAWTLALGGLFMRDSRRSEKVPAS